MNSVISKAKSTLKGIKDVDSANAAVPELEGMAKQVGAIAGLANSLPAPVKDQIKKGVTRIQ